VVSLPENHNFRTFFEVTHTLFNQIGEMDYGASGIDNIA
jgi:hypothetical protein